MKPNLKLVTAALESNSSKAEINLLWEEAYYTNRELALQTIMYIRDKQYWCNRKHFARVVYRWLLENDPEKYYANLSNFVMIGEWDDIFYSESVITPQLVEYLQAHIEDFGLRSALPRESVNKNLSRVLSTALWLTAKQYRMLFRIEKEDRVNTLYRPIMSYHVT